MDLRPMRPDITADQVDLKGAKTKWLVGRGFAVRSPEDRVDTGGQISRPERKPDAVVGTALERLQLPAQISAACQGNEWRPPVRFGLGHELDRVTVGRVDVEEDELRLESFQRIARGVNRGRLPYLVPAMAQVSSAARPNSRSSMTTRMRRRPGARDRARAERRKPADTIRRQAYAR